MAKYAFLTDRALLRITGGDNRKLLQGLITNNVEKISPDNGIFAALLSPQGKFLHDFFLLADGDDLLLDLAAHRLPDLLKRLKMYRLRADVTFEDETAAWRVAATVGNETATEAGHVEKTGDNFVLTDPRLAAIGQRHYLRDETALPKGDACTDEDWQTHLITLGIPSTGIDMIVDKTLMLEAGYEELNAIDFRKGCYVGQEITARSKYRANIRKRLLRVTSDQSLPAEGTITAEGKHAGDLRSVSGHQAIAFMRLEHIDQPALEIDGLPVKVEVPDWVRLPEQKDK